MKLPENVKRAVRGIMNASLEKEDTMLLTMMAMDSLKTATEYGSQRLVKELEDVVNSSAMLLVFKVMTIAESDHQIIMRRVN